MDENRNQEINNTNVLIHLAGPNGNTDNPNDKGVIFSCERNWECGKVLNDANFGIHWTQGGVSLYPWCTSMLRCKEETISGKAGNLSICLWIANSDPPMHPVSLNWPPSFDIDLKWSNYQIDNVKAGNFILSYFLVRLMTMTMRITLKKSDYSLTLIIEWWIQQQRSSLVPGRASSAEKFIWLVAQLALAPGLASALSDYSLVVCNCDMSFAFGRSLIWVSFVIVCCSCAEFFNW